MTMDHLRRPICLLLEKLFLLLVTLLAARGLCAREQKVRDVDINITLIKNGNIVIHERWDVDTGDKITEWYLVRENLGDIGIDRFSVFDGDNDKLEDIGEWDVNRTREEKAGKYGIVHKPDGVELCWGVGEYGDHVYHAIYVMTRAVKSLDDYDMLHLQVVSPGLSCPPQHVRVQVNRDEIQLDTTNTRIWGFGFEGRSAFREDGTIVFESDGPLDTEDSVIILLRFDKGCFVSPSVQERPFQEVLDRAMEGADFGDDEEDDPIATGIAFIATCLIMWFALLRPFFRIFKDIGSDKLKLGFKPSTVDWHRDIPLYGDLSMANYILSQSGNAPSSGGLPLASVLRLIHNGCLQVNRAVEGDAVLSFTGNNLDRVDEASKGLYSLLKQAAGEDKKLQDKEFSQWAKKHAREVFDWSSRTRRKGASLLSQQGWLGEKKAALTESGTAEARKLFGLKSFLSKFTLVDQREAFEANLWKEYMVYGALFGLTDRVSKQLKDIDPALFKETFHYDLGDFDSVMRVSRALSESVRTAALRGAPSYTSSGSGGSGGSSSSRGYGGHTSRGGGGGFSGGGRGGGGR